MGAVSQSRLTLCNPMDCRPPGSSVHGILQARTLEWVAISSFKWSSQLRDCKACLRHCRWILYYWTTGGCPWSLARGSSLKQTHAYTWDKWHQLEKSKTRGSLWAWSFYNPWAPGRICRKEKLHLSFPEVIWVKISERWKNILRRPWANWYMVTKMKLLTASPQK